MLVSENSLESDGEGVTRFPGRSKADSVATALRRQIRIHRRELDFGFGSLTFFQPDKDPCRVSLQPGSFSLPALTRSQAVTARPEGR